jgi:hypothetical protein
MASGTGITPVYTRPAWFRGTLLTSAYYFQTQRSSLAANGQGNVYSIYPNQPSESLPSVTANAIGGTAWSNSIVFQRASNASLGSNQFTSNTTQTFAAGTLTTAPIKFQAGTIATTPVVHSVEWDSTNMYVTTSAAERRTVATWTTASAPSAGQWLTWDATNSKWAPNTAVSVDSSNVLNTAQTKHSVSSSGAATVAAVLQNPNAASSTEVRLAFSSNTNVLADNRYAYISSINTDGTNAAALVLATQSGGNAPSERLRIDQLGNVYAASGVTTMNAGFIWVASAAGAPTVTPSSAPSGRVPLYYDTTANKLYVYNGGWKASAAFA